MVIKKIVSLSSLKDGELGIIRDNLMKGKDMRHSLDLGISNGVIIRCLYRSPFGDPVAYLVMGSVIAIRGDDARKIMVEVI